jgi:hypothetical protein
MRKKIPYEERCKKYFERRTKGRMYVNARWHCPRKKLKGLPYCSYCEPRDKKRERLAAKKAAADAGKAGKA